MLICNQLKTTTIVQGTRFFCEESKINRNDIHIDVPFPFDHSKSLKTRAQCFLNVGSSLISMTSECLNVYFRFIVYKSHS